MATRDVQPIRVLIVDDEPNVALTLVASLEKLGNELVVDTAHDFDDALAKVERTQYTLLIADYKLPGMSGVDLAQAVRSISPETQIVLMTAYGTAGLRETADLLGIAGYLDKPFSVARIRELVQRIVREATTTRRVLIMEDLDHVRRIYSRALQEADYTVYEATSFQQVRDLLAIHWFDVFICSLDIVGERGTTLLREQTTRLSQAGTHVIAISAQGQYRALCEEIGVEFFLETPIAIDPLVTLVDRLTAKR
jgi:DNA-binding NtrC family response regulator